MEINLITVLVATVVAMVVGGLWYSPLMFGKKWMEINGVTKEAFEAHKDAKNKEMMRLLVIQLVLTFFQVYVLAHFVNAWSDSTAVQTSLWIFLAFVIPTLAGAVMWTNESRKNAITRFLIQAGNQLVLFILFGFILGIWG